MPINTDLVTAQGFTAGAEILGCDTVPLIKADREIHREKHRVVTTVELVELPLGRLGIGQATVIATHHIGIIFFSKLPYESDLQAMSLEVI